MRNERRNYLMVGTFVIAMGVALIAWIAVLSGLTGATDRYYVLYDNVMGLARGGEVLFEGYRVGVIDRISQIEVEGRQRFRADIKVDRGWRIPEDSVAAITSGGLLSAVVIGIRSGDSATALAPGSEIEGEDAASLIAVATKVADPVTDVTRSLEPILEQLADGVPGIIEDIAVLTADLRDAVDGVNRILSPQNTGRVERSLANFEVTSASLATATGNLATTQSRLNALLDTLHALMDRNEGDLGHGIADLHHSLEAVARHIEAVSRNLEAATRNLSELSLEVRHDPSLLIRGRELPDGAEPQ
jgi:phospholipid/cholesterol/gamma-HCH transport system substrate-binding protein